MGLSEAVAGGKWLEELIATAVVVNFVGLKEIVSRQFLRCVSLDAKLRELNLRDKCFEKKNGFYRQAGLKIEVQVTNEP